MASQSPVGYARFEHGQRGLIADSPISQAHIELFSLFSRTALQSAFPCIGAQKVMRDYRVAFCFSPEPFNTIAAAECTAEYMYQWIGDAEYAALKQSPIPTAFATCVVVYPEAQFSDEVEGERQLWEFLAKVHRYDKDRHPWSDESSPFVYDKRFSMSLGGYAQFILFFSPSATTPSRRFSHPMLVFNPHFIFETMRKAEIFADWRDAIRKREATAQEGWKNPKLADFGSLGSLEAAQYALTINPVFDIGDCPFTGKSRPVDIPVYDMRGNPFITPQK